MVFDWWSMRARTFLYLPILQCPINILVSINNSSSLYVLNNLIINLQLISIKINVQVHELALYSDEEFDWKDARGISYTLHHSTESKDLQCDNPFDPKPSVVSFQSIPLEPDEELQSSSADQTQSRDLLFSHPFISILFASFVVTNSPSNLYVKITFVSTGPLIRFPSIHTASLQLTFTAGELTNTPFTLTRPLTINSSALRREHTPLRAM